MKKRPFRYVALLVVAVLALSCVGYADEPASSSPEPVESEAPVAATSTPAPDVSVEADPAPVTDNAFVSALSTMFGPYSPRTQTVVTTYADGTVVEVQEPVPGLAGLDWPWLAGVFLFAVVLVCLFKIVGVVAKK